MLLRAIEEKRFLPLGSDKETESDFQLICGTNRDLRADVAAGRFREDLLSRIDLWSFRMPGLAERREDIEPNLDYELDQWHARTGKRLSFNKEARARFLAWALDPATPWRGNFREFNACVTRLATLADGGRVTKADVEAEIKREMLNAECRMLNGGSLGELAPPEQGDVLADILGNGYETKFDRFELAQLREVAAACRESRTAAEAGKRLFAVSRKAKKTSNDTDRLAKYLAKFGLSFKALAARPS